MAKTVKKDVKKKKPAAAKKAPAPAKKKASPAKKAVAKKHAPARKGQASNEERIRDQVVDALDKAKAEDIVCVDVRGQSSIADFMVIATGRSNRQVGALADYARKALFECGIKQVRIEGLPQGDWVVVDGGDVIVHLFRPEVRAFYRLEEVWGLEPPLQDTFKNL